VRPTYAAAFRCIGASCEDTCCGEWEIPVDRWTYERYRQFPAERLGSVVSQFVSIRSASESDALYAEIQRGPSGLCPFFGTDHLCGIEKEYGRELLSATCSIYPRSLSRVAGELEGALSLSCPEAARNVLLDPDFMQIEADLFSGAFRTDNVFELACERNGSDGQPEGAYRELRVMLIETVRDRSRPLWLRVLLIGWLCGRMEGNAGGQEGFRGILEEHRLMVQGGELPAELRDLRSDARLRFEVIFELCDARLREGAGSRFQDIFWAFVEGVGEVGGAGAEDDVVRFQRAEEEYYRPFFERSPFILENYLINYIFQNLFPYGRTGGTGLNALGFFGEYLQMTMQFAWINALLVGVAGRYKSAFAEEHVVKTIQSVTRAVEHYPDVLRSISGYVTMRGLDSLDGMAVMLRS